MVVEPGAKTRLDMWTTANSGFVVAKPTKISSDPTMHQAYDVEDGHTGKGARMETEKTGLLGGKSKPITAGNLFLGMFKLDDDPLNYPLRATKFGIPTDRLPVQLKGYYRYRSGDVFND